MAILTDEQREALEAAGWTEAEAVQCAQAIAGWREGLPPRQREASSELLATAGAATDGDVQG